jgi:hypothetical protein
MKVITTCANCQGKLRVPGDLGVLIVTCPRCRHRWEWGNEEPLAGARNPVPVKWTPLSRPKSCLPSLRRWENSFPPFGPPAGHSFSPRTPFTLAAEGVRGEKECLLIPPTAAPGRPPPASGSPGTGAVAPRCRTPQHKTPLIDVRTVRYPFHPWYGREVYVLDQGVRHGQAVLDCRLDRDHARALEIPAWMLDEAACSTARITTQPGVSFQALRRLRQLLDARSAPTSSVDDQHPFGPSNGDADDPERTDLATSPTPDTAAASRADLGGTSLDSPAPRRSTPGPDAAGLPGPSAHRPDAPGGHP